MGTSSLVMKYINYLVVRHINSLVVRNINSLPVKDINYLVVKDIISSKVMMGIRSLILFLIEIFKLRKQIL